MKYLISCVLVLLCVQMSLGDCDSTCGDLCYEGSGSATDCMDCGSGDAIICASYDNPMSGSCVDDAGCDDYPTLDSYCFSDYGCPDGYFLDTTSNVCTPCDVTCGSCDGSATACTSCIGIDYPFLLREEGMGEGSCVLECDTADYVDSGINKCRHCMTQCATCLDGTSCTACATETNYLLVVNHLDGSGICTSTCPGIIDEDIMRCILDRVPLYQRQRDGQNLKDYTDDYE